MWTVLLSSDYYGDSVALALAGGKQSRLPTAFDVSSVT
jgi:hypothetical protein